MNRVKGSQRFVCPSCKIPMEVTAIWRRRSDGTVVRRRKCDTCGLRLSTHEREVEDRKHIR